MISNEKPRFPGTTLDERQSVYKDVLGVSSLQAVAATATIAMGEVKQDTILKSLFAVFNQALAAAGPETLTIDVVYAPPGGGVNVNVAAAPVAFVHASGAGVRLPIALAASFVAGGSRIPAGSVLYAIRTLANGSVAPPTNIVAAELATES